MKVQSARPWMTALLACVMAAGAWAQAVPENEPPQPVPGLVLSDVQPLPAEDRESMGAVVLDDSRVRAQRAAAFQSSAERTGIPSVIGRHVTRLMETVRSWNDVREADATLVPTQ